MKIELSPRLVSHAESEIGGSDDDPTELMERLMNSTLQYFEDRSQVSCMHLSFFLSVWRMMLV